MGSPGGSLVKSLPLTQELQEPRVQSLAQEGVLEGEWQPSPVLLPGESHGQRSLVGQGPRGCKELDMTSD